MLRVKRRLVLRHQKAWAILKFAMLMENWDRMRSRRVRQDMTAASSSWLRLLHAALDFSRARRIRSEMFWFTPARQTGGSVA